MTTNNSMNPDHVHGLFGSTPFYERPTDQTNIFGDTTEKIAASQGPDQRTLDDWHYRLTTLLQNMQGDFDRNEAIRDLQEVTESIYTYLKG